MGDQEPKVTAIVVAYLAEEWLEPSIAAILASAGVRADVVLVDNGCTDGAVDRIDGTPGVTVLRPGANLGFAGGCNLGATAATGDLLALVNPDARVDPHALARLAAVAARPGVGIATASVRLADDPARLNCAGNEIHISGLSWSGHFGEPAADHPHERPSLGASGAGMVLRREVWDDLDGFDKDYFAYHEDAELSVRCWQSGRSVIYVPDAVVVHRYEFGRTSTKYFLLERNRALLVLTCYSARMLLAVLPVLVLVEAATFGMAVAQGWWRHKLRAVWWVLRHPGTILRRRRWVQSRRRVPDRELAARFSTHLSPGNADAPPGVGLLEPVLAVYWRIAQRIL